MKTSQQGQIAEDKARQFLERKGLTLIEKNYRCRTGEIDLIMQDKKELVFVEVRYRASETFGRASDTVDNRKQRKIIRTAALYVARNPGLGSHTMRFDVFAIEGCKDTDYRMTWIKDAFRPNNSTL